MTNFEIQRCFDDELLFNGVFCRNNLPTPPKDGGYSTNLDNLGKAGTHWVAIFVNDFDSFCVEHMPRAILRFLQGKDVDTNIYRIEVSDFVMCGYYCIKFLDYMFVRKSLTDFTSLFSPTDFALNDKIITKLFDI